MLRIKRIEVFLVRIPLRFSIEHALAARTANITGFVTLTSEDGISGIGEFLSREYVTGETVEDCVHFLKQAAPLLTRSAIENPVLLIESLWNSGAHVRGRHAAVCALDLAMLDLWGKFQGTPAIEAVQPGPRRAAQTPIYSGVYPFAHGLKLLVLHVFYRGLMHLTHLKVKGYGDVERDVAYVQKIRHAFPYPVQVRLDLNGSLLPNHADVYFSRMLNLKEPVAWFEQPFPAEAWEASQRFQKRFASEAIFCADESVCSMEDLERIIREGAFRAVNIRIGKNGGLLSSLKLYRKALESGLETQLGCLVGESSILAYAGLHFASIADQLRYHEGCFGKLLIKWDVVNPSLTFSHGGYVSLNQLPKAGLVPMVNVDRLRRRAFQSEVLEEKL